MARIGLTMEGGCGLIGLVTDIPWERGVRCEKRIWQQAGDLRLMNTYTVGTGPRGDRGREVVQAPFLNEIFF